MIGDLDKRADATDDTAAPTEAELRALTGADEVIWRPFDHGAELGMMARWGNLAHAERVRVSGRKRHPNNATWTKYWPLRRDFYDVANALKAWHDRRP